MQAGRQAGRSQLNPTELLIFPDRSTYLEPASDAPLARESRRLCTHCSDCTLEDSFTSEFHLTQRQHRPSHSCAFHLTFSPDVKYVRSPSKRYAARTREPSPPSSTPRDSRYSFLSASDSSDSSASTCALVGGRGGRGEGGGGEGVLSKDIEGYPQRTTDDTEGDTIGASPFKALLPVCVLKLR